MPRTEPDGGANKQQVIADPLGCRDDNKDGMPDYIPMIAGNPKRRHIQVLVQHHRRNERRAPQAHSSDGTPAGSGTFVYDSSAFFPIAPTEGLGPSPMNSFNAGGKNFLFTTEIHVRFGYVAGQKFTFRGDDDLWIFVNGKLLSTLVVCTMPS